jgi:uncharacterized membrane protein YbhN (UPF0104 family)
VSSPTETEIESVTTPPAVTSDEPSRGIPWRRVVACTVGALVALSIALVVVRELGHASALTWQFQPAWLALAVIGFTALHLAHAELWRRLAGRFGKHVSRPEGYSLWCTSTVARYVPSSLLMVVMRISMGARAGIPRRLGASLVVQEAALAFTGALLISGVFVIQLDALDGNPVRFLVLGVPLAAAFVLHPRVLDRAMERVLTKVGRAPLEQSVASPPRTLALFVALYAISFVIGGLSLYALTHALVDVDVSDASDIVAIVAAFAVGYNLSVLGAVMPGGLGIREAAITAALAVAMPTAAAAAVAIALRLVQLAIELIAAGSAHLWARRHTRTS